MENEHPADNQMFWQKFFGPNFGYILELYEAYREDKDSVSQETRALFEEYGDPNVALQLGMDTSVSTGQGTFSVAPEHIAKALEYARNIRMYGHLAAAIDPIYDAPSTSELELSSYGIREADLSAIPAKAIMPTVPVDVRTARDAISKLRDVYTGRHGYEFNQVTDALERAWLEAEVESGNVFKSFSKEEKKQLLVHLAQTELFEKFLHRQFVGQKRFSVEGLDALVPMVDKLVHEAANDGVKNVTIGMAHRGRLNVLAHVLRKPYERIFSEFHAGNNMASDEEMEAFNNGWGGDVKYHQGWRHDLEVDGGKAVNLILPNNPSHLEVVDPVVEGIVRAAQEDRNQAGEPRLDASKALPIAVHGDAAFAGEGVVTETLNFSQIRGYYTGGTVHIIANNHVGFTADPEQGRSTRYASDPAKGYEIPVIHVSADDPEACLAAISFAFRYRQKFHKDFLIDLIGYRRWGHNEMDDPSMTQPVLYNIINSHKTVKTLYAEQLQAEGVLTAEEVAQIDQAITDDLKKAHKLMAQLHDTPAVDDFREPQVGVEPVAIDTLREINDALLQTPDDFTTYPKLKKILDRRIGAVDNGDIDWAHAESLAFATVLQSGTPIRLTGQDSERGTFGQRHLVLHDVNDGHKYTPLQHLPGANASFIVYNSPLSETSVIGFEYGYNIEAPEALVIWEGQFGDFVNVAQPMIDQFIAAGRAKWGESSGLVMLLPHGYEGQASEHSSGRVERFLQLCAKNNMFVANVTTSAQYYHLLRLQAARLGSNARPLIVMTPKSLLRNVKAASKGTDLAEGKFETVLTTDVAEAKKVTRLVLSSGKVGVDLSTELEKRDGDYAWLATARVEQIYPFPADRIKEILSTYKNVKEVVWLQEEPQNAGAWSFVAPRLQELLQSKVKLSYVGRPEQAFPAEGSPDVHNREQARIITAALNATL